MLPPRQFYIQADEMKGHIFQNFTIQWNMWNLSWNHSLVKGIILIIVQSLPLEAGSWVTFLEIHEQLEEADFLGEKMTYGIKERIEILKKNKY